jgi:hypothetical protein
MFVVPLRGDKVETKDGVTFTVLSYTNYKEKGPAIYVEHTAGVPSDPVYFFDISKINGKTVEFVPGSKIFRVGAALKRRFQLPQVGDNVTYKDKTGPGVIKVTGLKLHKRDELGKGLFIAGNNKDSESKVYIRLDQIVDIERDIGNDLFSRDRFLSYYSDYRGSR